MKVEIFRLTGEPVSIEVRENGTVRDVFSHPDSGKVLGKDGSLRDAADEEYSGVEGLGTLRVNGASAGLDTPVRAGTTILIIPKVEGGRAVTKRAGGSATALASPFRRPPDRALSALEPCSRLADRRRID